MESLVFEGSTSTFSVVHQGRRLGQVRLRIPGRHYVLDASAALAAGLRMGFGFDDLRRGLESFSGTRRRMELKGEVAGVRVYDSYAHHPKEIAGDLQAARSLAGDGRVVVAFQPHLVSRTKIFGPAMGEALGAADVVVVMDVYVAREDPEPGVNGAMVASHVPLPADDVRFVPSWAATPGVLVDLARPGDLVLTLGAGDVTLLGPEVLSLLAERAGGGRRPRRPECSRCVPVPSARSPTTSAGWSRPDDGSCADSGPAAGWCGGGCWRCWRCWPRSAGLVWVVFFSSVLAVKGAVVEGVEVLTVEQVRAVADVPEGVPLATADLEAVRARVETLAPVRAVEVSRSWPDQVRIVVRGADRGRRRPERGRLAGARRATGCSSGSYPQRPEGLPEVRMRASTPVDALAEAAAVLEALPGDLLGRVQFLDVRTIDAISLTLQGGAVVNWGSAEQSARKVQVLEVLLEQEARTYDVTAPGAPHRPFLRRSSPESATRLRVCAGFVVAWPSFFCRREVDITITLYFRVRVLDTPRASSPPTSSTTITRCPTGRRRQ